MLLFFYRQNKVFLETGGNHRRGQVYFLNMLLFFNTPARLADTLPASCPGARRRPMVSPAAVRFFSTAAPAARSSEIYNKIKY